MPKDIFKKIDYYDKYYKRGFRKFTKRNCLICDCEMVTPNAFDSITTCSEYCRNIKLTLVKKRGKYILCRVCDKLVWCQPKKNHQFCSVECKNIGTSIFTSERNIIRGKYKKYYGDNWISQRDRARTRDGFCCTKCGISEKDYGKQLSVHHIIPFLMFESFLDANELENLDSLCEPCHRKVHSGDLHPSKYITK